MKVFFFLLQVHDLSKNRANLEESLESLAITCVHNNEQKYSITKPLSSARKKVLTCKKLYAFHF